MESSTGTYSTLFPEMEFFRPDLREFTTRGLDAPVLEQRLFPALLREHLVIIGGPDTEEKPYLAKHLAWKATAQFQDDQCIRQWHQAASLVRLSDALDRHPSRTVFLLDGLEPHHLGGYDLERFLEHLQSSDQYVIVTTESAPTAWGAGEWVRQHIWQDVSGISFPAEVLAEILLDRFQDLSDQLPADLASRMEGASHDAALAGNMTILGVAGRLKTPTRVRLFARALARREKVTEATVEEVLERVLDPGRHASWWYLQLEPREQNLVLGLSLLDGLLDDQVFAALELVVRQVWREWEPDLCQYDYHELSEVSAYYTPSTDSTRSGLIQCLSPACREAFIETAWRFHRRRILATLPTLVEMVRDAPGTGLGLELEPYSWGGRSPAPSEEGAEEVSEAAAEEPENPPDEAQSQWSDDEVRASRWYRHGRWRDLFGSPLRSRLLCHGVAGLLSLIGRLAPDAVEPVLLDMAADHRRTVQHVAALALARWRVERDREAGDKRLYRILSAWENEAKFKELAQHLRRRRSAAEPFARVRATIALTVGRAALYDRPNQLDEGLVKLFERLVLDRSPMVRECFGSMTLPLVMAGHLRQVEPLLWRRAVTSSELHPGLAMGVALVHQLRPAEARQVLESWRRRAGSISETDPDADARERRICALAVVALACGLLEPAKHEVFGILQGLLAGEADPLVRSAVLHATLQQARMDLPKVAAPIQELVADLTLEEREYLVRGFTGLYLAQRRSLASTSLPGAVEPDATVIVGGAVYPLWLRSQRPRTPVEDVLQGWLDDPGHPAAVQLALDCLDRFAATALEEREQKLMDGLDEDAEEAGEGELVAADPSGWSRLHRLSLLGHLVVWLAAPLDSHRRGQLRAALPEYLTREIGLLERWRLVKAVWREVRDEDEADEARWSELARVLWMAISRGEAGARLLRRLGDDPANVGLARSLWIAAWIHALRWLWLPTGVALVVAVVLALT